MSTDEGECVMKLLIAVLFLWMIFEVVFAPEGYEDEDGFHYGHEKKESA